MYNKAFVVFCVWRFFLKGFVSNTSGKKQVKVTYTPVISKNNTMSIFATEI